MRRIKATTRIGRHELRHVADAVEQLQLEPGDLALHRKAVRLIGQHAIGRAEQDADRHVDFAVALDERGMSLSTATRSLEVA